jgi:photosystem II stability/assembly factor-like uncharacterized protein
MGCSQGEGGGIVVSPDRGKSWKATSMTTGKPLSLGFASGADGPIFAGLHAKGIFRSDDQGATWSLVNADPHGNGKPENLRPFLAVDPNNSDLLLVGLYRAGIVRSDDGGATFADSSAGLNPETSVTDVVFDPAHTGVVYAASSNAGIFYSTDHGEHWTALNQGLTRKDVRRVALTSDGGTLLAATIGAGAFRLGPVPSR